MACVVPTKLFKLWINFLCQQGSYITRGLFDLESDIMSHHKFNLCTICPGSLCDTTYYTETIFVSDLTYLVYILKTRPLAHLHKHHTVN